MLFQTRFHPAEGPDPRSLLAATAVLSDDEIGELGRRLARLDRASSHGSKLKNLGLTLSLEVGYRLSPRGEAYLAATHAS